MFDFIKNRSIRSKIFAIFLVTVFISTGVIAWYGFSSAKKAYRQAAISKVSDKVEIIHKKIDGILDNIPKHVLFNSNIHSLKRYIIWNSLKEKRKIQYWGDIYVSNATDFLKNLQIFHQMRILGIDGNEKIRLIYDVVNNRVEKEKNENLQNKSSRRYFQEAIKLKKGEFYISEMDLNKEHGVIERPFVPVVRYATPVVDKNNDIKSILVMNLRANIILDLIEEEYRKDKNLEYFLINKDGYYLYNKNKEKMWGFELQKSFNFNKDYYIKPKEYLAKDKVSFVKGDYIYSIEKIYPNKKYYSDRYWFLVGIEKTDIAFSSLSNFVTIFIFLLMGLFAVSLFIVNSYLKFLITPLGKVNDKLKLLSKGIVPRGDEIKYDSKDEIGDIVKSTSILVRSIDSVMEQSKAVSKGDFSKEFHLLSKDDELGSSILDMKKRLTEITSIATRVSVGDYDAKISVMSSEDVLGKALNNMIEYLKELSKVAESIAKGNIDISYKSKGKNDRLSIALLRMIQYLKSILKQANTISKGDYSKSITIKSKDDELGMAMMTMTNMLRDSYIKNKNEVWFRTGVSEFGDKLTGLSDTVEISKLSISLTCRYINAASGVVYLCNDEQDELSLIASFSYKKRDHILTKVKVGEGVVGQVALEKEPIHLTNIKDDDFSVESGTVLTKSKEVYLYPLIHENELFGVVEIMSFEKIDTLKEDYLLKTSEIFATVIHTAKQNAKIKKLLEESQKAYEELQTQSEELQETNVQMEEQQQQLELQAKEMKIKNEALMKVKEELNARAKELEDASRYKNEFLANMSHELRTPLNSIILLSKLLKDNGKCNEEDKEKAKVINKAGNDLLLLINDILDLSKIESGRMELDEVETSTSEIAKDINDLFYEVATNKKLYFTIEDKAKTRLKIDKTKLLQILKNLVSNAIKFTEKGSIVLDIIKDDKTIYFSVKDSGIGIPQEKISLIFEAFRQVDGSVSRKYGGTGLGLSISKTFAKLLGGDIEVESEVGKGSVFTLQIPLKTVKGGVNNDEIISNQEDKSFNKDDMETLNIKDSEEIDDMDIEKNMLEDKNVLIVDDDSRNIFSLSSLLQNYGAETFSALNGKEAIEFLKKEGEDIDIILMDIMMPENDGLETIKSIRSMPKFANTAIFVVSAKSMKKDRQDALDAGANEFFAKPVDTKKLLKIISAWV